MAKGFFGHLLSIVRSNPREIPSADKEMDRRRFFRAGLAEMLRPLESAMRPLEQVANQVAKLDRAFPEPPPTRDEPAPSRTIPLPAYVARDTSRDPRYQRPVIRPPGAMPEQQFLDTCSRCGDCVRVCPAQCIKIDNHSYEGGGAPFIDVNTAPCVMCDGLQCMHVCPTGALSPIPIDEIDMGTAEWFSNTCVRTKGEDCTMCIDHCPVGSVAIQLLDGKVDIIEEGCTGCGSCQHYCPTDPKSIIVLPRTAR